MDKIHAADIINIERAFQCRDGSILEGALFLELLENIEFGQLKHIEACSHNAFEIIRHRNIEIKSASRADY